jgi:hypothetical protein
MIWAMQSASFSGVQERMSDEVARLAVDLT